MTPTILEKSILATLEYYNCFDWPLSTFELWLVLILPLTERQTTNNQRPATSLSAVVTTLEQSDYLKQYISHKNGFWFLRGKEHLFARRIEATKEAEEKMKRVFAYRWLFIGTPFLEGAFVSGSVACGWPTPESDIDILVVARKGRIWTTRFLLTLASNVLGVRRRGAHSANRFCLNHYIANDNLFVPFKSLYNAHTYMQLIPVVNRKSVFERFFSSNAWIKEYVANPLGTDGALVYISQFPVFSLLEKFMKCERGLCEFILKGFLGEAIERLTKRIQLYFIDKNPLTQKGGGRITAQDFQLEFHPQSKEEVILRRYNKKLQALGLKEFYPEKDSGLR